MKGMNSMAWRGATESRNTDVVGGHRGAIVEAEEQVSLRSGKAAPLRRTGGGADSDVVEGAAASSSLKFGYVFLPAEFELLPVDAGVGVPTEYLGRMTPSGPPPLTSPETAMIYCGHLFKHLTLKQPLELTYYLNNYVFIYAAPELSISVQTTLQTNVLDGFRMMTNGAARFVSGTAYIASSAAVRLKIVGIQKRSRGRDPS
ncbi:hypothetical protein C8R43DRAFT_1112332 [Mycena crocata]|nr:hypothetical protein C8R43DRAFT_1112332 [Mycena crocata]